MTFSPPGTDAGEHRRVATPPSGGAAAGLSAAAPQASPVVTPVTARPEGRADWVGAWANVPRPAVNLTGVPEGEPVSVTDRTIRQTVRINLGGDHARVRLTNAHAAAPVILRAAHLAVADGEAGIFPETDRVLTFGGRPSIILAPDAVVVSDPVALAVQALGHLAVSLYLPGTITLGQFDVQQVSVSPAGDFTGEAAMPVDANAGSSVLLSGIDVTPTAPAGAIVAFGDSLTDGAGSTPGANRRWTDVLAARLHTAAGQAPLAVLNAGITGNRLLHDGPGATRFAVGVNALARFDRDALAQPGATHVIALEGVNDIGYPLAMRFIGQEVDEAEVVSADDIIAALRILAERARGNGLTIIGATLTPFGGSIIDAPETEGSRQAVNNWIRAGGAFDAAIDFDAAVRDPDQPARLLPEHDSGDHLHLSDAGYRAMGEAIDLALFQGSGE